jgi:hypothetical protein
MKRLSKHSIKMRVLTAALVVSTSCLVTTSQEHTTMRQRQKVLFEIEAPDRADDLVSPQQNHDPQNQQQLVKQHSMYEDVEERLTRKRMVSSPTFLSQQIKDDETATFTKGRALVDIITKWDAIDRYLELDLSLSLSLSMSL